MMNKYYIRTDCTKEMNKACIDYLITLSNKTLPITLSASLYTKNSGYLYLENNEITDFKQLNKKSEFTEVFLSPKKHTHYDLIVKWAEDPSQKVWFSWKEMPGWHLILPPKNPLWLSENSYHIGDTPPFSNAPLTQEQAEHLPQVYLIHLGHPDLYQASTPRLVSAEYYSQNLVYDNKEAAIAAANKMLDFLKTQFLNKVI